MARVSTDAGAPTGYLHAEYARSFGDVGVAHELPASRGWIVKRQVDGRSQWDAMGCYPLFSCQHWAGLEEDLEQLEADVVCLSLVTDPFGDYTPPYLQACFADVCSPFKEHFVVDLSQPMDRVISSHHRRNISRADRALTVERCSRPHDHLDDWTRLYRQLIARHDIRGIASFSRASFARQFAVPGLSAFRAVANNTTVGMVLFFQQHDVAYYHLGAYSETGYAQKASFALFWHAIQHFTRAGLAWMNLGAGAGARAGDGGEDGLSRFKRGWSTGTRTSYFCGRVFDRPTYAALTRDVGPERTDYFPAYRAGEFR